MISVRGAEQCSTRRKNPRVNFDVKLAKSLRDRGAMSNVFPSDNSFTHPLYFRPLDDASPYEQKVKYGVRSPKFIWAPVYSCNHCLRSPNSPPPSAFELIYEGAIGQPR